MQRPVHEAYSHDPSRQSTADYRPLTAADTLPFWIRRILCISEHHPALRLSARKAF